MKNRGVTIAVILLALITPAIGIDHPVEPFEKAKAMVLMEGRISEKNTYMPEIEGWGAIIYTPGDGSIPLVKGTLNDNAGVVYYGESREHFLVIG